MLKKNYVSEQEDLSYYGNDRDCIRYVSAACGSGKTYAVCKKIAANLNRSNHLYVAPTLNLINETRRLLESFGVTCIVITSQDQPERRVVRDIFDFLMHSEERGCVLLICFSSYIRLPYFHNKENWAIFIDEIPKLDTPLPQTLSVPPHKELLLERLEAEPYSQNLLRVMPVDHDDLRHLLEEKMDDVLDVFRELFWACISENYEVFIDTHSWNTLIGRDDHDDHDVDDAEHDNAEEVEDRCGDDHTINFYSILTADAFRGTTIMAANVEDSLLYLRLKREGETFRINDEIYGGLRKLKPVGHRLSIRYLVPHSSFSKYLGTRKVGKAILLDEMDKLALESFQGQDFLYVSNKSRPKPETEEWANATCISTAAHGLNEYTDHTNFYFSAATNRKPHEIRMLVELGFTKEEIQKSTAFEIVYQCLFRTSLRDDNSDACVTALVPDKGSAEWLAQLTGCLDVCQLGSLIEDRLPALPNTQRHRNSRAKKSMQLIDRNLTQVSLDTKENRVISGLNPNDEEGNPLTMWVTLHKRLKTSDPEDFVRSELPISDFLKQLKTFYKNAITNKEDNYYYNSGIFQPAENATGYRTHENFKYSTFMILDFDGGILTPKVFEEIFYQKGNGKPKTSFIICNSFSCSPDNPNKYRVIMPYKRPALSIQEHQDIFDAIVSKLREAGYFQDAAKLDPACRSGVQSFFLPCTNRRFPESAFFRTYGMRARELERYAIDPIEIRHLPKPEPIKQTVFPASREVSREEIDAVTANFRSSSDGRNAGGFHVALQLAIRGMTKNEVETELYAIAGEDKKMKNRVRGAVNNVEKYGHFRR